MASSAISHGAYTISPAAKLATVSTSRACPKSWPIRLVIRVNVAVLTDRAAW
jgi:hypothetical protein